MRALLPLLLCACAPTLAEVEDTNPIADEPDAAYSATWLATALDRLLIRRQADATCAFLVLVSPGYERDGFEVDAPESWSAESGVIVDGDVCEWGVQGADRTEAVAASGAVSWIATSDPWVPPQALTVDVVVAFLDGRSSHFDAIDVPVGN